MPISTLNVAPPVPHPSPFPDHHQNCSTPDGHQHDHSSKINCRKGRAHNLTYKQFLLTPSQGPPFLDISPDTKSHPRTRKLHHTRYYGGGGKTRWARRNHGVYIRFKGKGRGGWKGEGMRATPLLSSTALHSTDKRSPPPPSRKLLDNISYKHQLQKTNPRRGRRGHKVLGQQKNKKQTRRKQSERTKQNKKREEGKIKQLRPSSRHLSQIPFTAEKCLAFHERTK